MEITDKLRKPVEETKYLNVENTDRYRAIIRFFYLQYEKLTYWMYAEDVYEELKKSEYFSDYTLEQCQQDLAVLQNWKNLFAMQDTRKVSTIEEFKNKKFRYQLSEYSVEIERMVIKLENLQIEGASLEPTLLERLRQNIMKASQIYTDDAEKVHGWWNELNNNFVLLNQNYQDYMRELNSLKAEEMMKTREFLVFKDKLIDYLRGFVKNLQYNVGIIEQALQKMDTECIETIISKVVERELSIPRLDFQVTRAQIEERIRGRYRSIYQWFVGEKGHAPESDTVFDTTNEIIRKITRYAAQISEQSGSGANRREEYAKVISMFRQCESIEEAHKLSAAIFGMEQSAHLKGDFIRETESINSGVYEEEPFKVQIMPRVRNYREKARKTPIVDRTAEKEAAKEAALRRSRREQEMLRSYIKDGELDFAGLPVIEPEVRDTFLLWLSKALENKEREAKTEEGKEYFVVEPENQEYCTLECTDGYFKMPAYRIIFR